MKWHEEVLDEAGHAAAARLGAATRDFYLAGGTALALRLGHRVSLDLDLFSAKNALGAGQRRTLLEDLKATGPLKIKEEKDGTCHLDLGGTSVSLFHYDYPILGTSQSWRGLEAASLEDIAAMKLSAVLGRGSKKDFIDLYELCRRLGLDRVMTTAGRKFPRHADFPLQAARALLYFDDAQKEPMPRMLGPGSWEDVKSYFEGVIPRYVKDHLKR
ncbi:MAG: nucleotidyl transferase AbiEii/AbiGii toxin family protein [Elusimicrobiota bacterium]